MASVADRPAASSPDGAAVASWPLVARDRELHDLAAAVAAGSGGYVVGDAGVGKTRLVTEAVGRAADAGVTPLWVAATQAAASIPLSPFLALLPADLAAANGDRLALFRSVTEELARRSADGRTAVVVDDAHLLAEPAAALLLHLALDDVPVVAVVRAGVDVPDAVTALWKDGHLPRVELGPLDEPAVGDLLATALGGPVERTTVTRLHEATGGNPLFLRELVLAGVRAGALALSDGLWRAVEPLPVGRSLRELVRRRIDHLPPDVRTTLELLAMAEEWPAEALRAEHRHAVELLEEQALVRVDREGRRLTVRPAHPILGEAIRADLGAIARQAGLRELIALQQDAGLRRRDDRLRLATWQLEVGGEVDRDALIAAARRALQLMDPDLAARLARAAGAAGGGAEASVLLASAEIERNRFDAAEAELASCEQEALSGRGVVAYAVQRGFALGLGLGEIDAALAFLDRAGRHVPPAEEARVAALRAMLLAAAYRVGEAAPLAHELAARPDADPAALMTATAPAGMALNAAGLFDQTIARCGLAMPLVAAHGSEFPRERIFVLGPLLVALLMAGRYAEVEALVRPEYDAAVASRDESTRGGAAGVLGTLSLESGHPRRARRWLQEAVVPLLRSDPFGLLSPTLGRLALAEALTGDAAAARTAFDRAVAAVRGQLRWDVLPLFRAEVWLLVAEGDLAGARALALRHADAYPESAIHRAVLLHDAVRLGETGLAARRTLVELTDRFEGARFAAVNAHARAVVGGDPEQLWAAVDALARDDSLLSAVDAAATAARLFHLAGQPRRESAARHRALELLGEARAAPTPAVRALTPTPLTRREQQIVALATQRLSDREIADRLGLSVRTVESHLHRAYSKLGVTGRAGLRGHHSAVPP